MVSLNKRSSNLSDLREYIIMKAYFKDLLEKFIDSLRECIEFFVVGFLPVVICLGVITGVLVILWKGISG